MVIRVLTRGDAEVFWPLRLRALREHPEAFGQSFDEQRDTPISTVVERFDTNWATPHSFLLGAFADDRLIGSIGCIHDQSLKVRHKAALWGMYVAPEARGSGVGMALLLGAVRLTRERWPGVEQIRLAVVTTNQAARRLYLSTGFVVYGLERRALRLGSQYLDEEFMALNLLPSPDSSEGSLGLGLS